jgi:hypothetical protein
VAEKPAMKVAGLVVTTGGPIGLRVVNVVSLPYVVPQLFIATVRKWYVVLGFNP